jgi:hypothetical protein
LLAIVFHPSKLNAANKGELSMMPTKQQIARLKATGKVVDVEDEGMDEERFFVHLHAPYSWDDGYGVQRTKSFGSFSEALKRLKSVKPE